MFHKGKRWMFPPFAAICEIIYHVFKMKETLLVPTPSHNC